MSGGKPAFRWLRRLRKPRRDWLSTPEHAALAAELTEPREWQTHDRRPPHDNELYRIFARTRRSKKWLHYFDVYTQIFASFRDRPINFLEIGVHGGGSLKMWKKYFHSDSRIVGIDNAPDCASYDNPVKNIFVRIGEQQDDDFLRSVIDEFGPFDIVLDDGSHMASHMLRSFNVLFASGMSEQSIYVVEDLHTNFHPGFADGAVPFLDVVKHLVDVMHAHYHNMHRHPSAAFHSTGEPMSFTVPAITLVLDQIQVFDSIAVLHRRANRQTPVHIGAREAAGQLAASRAP